MKHLNGELFKRFRHKPQRSIRFYKYFFSYIVVIVVLLLLIGFVVYGNFMKLLQGEVEHSNRIALSQIRYAVDLRLEEMSHIALQIATNPRLTPYMASNGGYDSYEAIEELQKYRDSNSFIQNIVVYYGGKYANRMYSANTSFSPEQFFDHYYKYEEWNLEQFRNSFATLSKPLMRPVETVQINGIRSVRLATYLYPLPAYAKPYGVILFQISEASLGGIVQDALQNYRGDLYIFDADKQLVYSLTSGETGMDHDLSALDLDTLTQPVSTLHLGEDSLSLIRQNSGESGWTYLIVLPTKHLLLKVQHGRNVFNYTAVAVLLLGMAMSFGLAANNYRPLRKLAKELEKQVEGDSEPKYADEIAYLSRAIGEVANERRGLMARLDSRTGLMKEQVLLTLLKGKTENPEQLRQLFDISAIKLDKPYFAVLLFSVDDYQTFQQAISPSMRDLYLFCIINVVEELAKEIGS
ncbi:MAG: AraC family transcriptional regulator, partial [Paenibacillaceae bacterium]|nr:AraC family transcriptional regulator [Paenibacillaceae bacterium]